MEWKATWDDPLTRYLAPYHELIGDKRTHKTFDARDQRTYRSRQPDLSADRNPFSAVVSRKERLESAFFAWQVERVRSAHASMPSM
jgi:hypothetical protein